ncbi:MAG TPA: GNAT family protein [Anaerolineae bacterium]|nr:GNAT family protein [Anaerolineae bacterium]
MNLLTGQLVSLTAVNPDRDAGIIARWSRDSQFWRLAHTDPALPVLPRYVKQKLEERSIELQGFAIRSLADDRLIGLIGLYTIFWLHREAFMGIQIGERDYWGKGYGTDALRALLRYGFDELNLRRVSLSVLEGNERAMRSYEKCGFRYEGRERQVWAYDGRRWDEIFMGLLREEWQTMGNEQ